MAVDITFLGAAGTVTGSKTLVEYNDYKVMVDCGLFQGLKTFRRLNWTPLEVAPAFIDAVILTHAHLDHCGYLPLLVKYGFNGKIYATQPTIDLVRIILVDSAKIQEEEAERANRGRYTKHKPAKPLYTMKDAMATFSLMIPVADNHRVTLHKDVEFQFIRNGHILGSSFVELYAGKKKIVFSGDLGRPKHLLLEPPTKITNADVLVLESTYGDRDHPASNPQADMEQLVTEALEKNGTLIIPTFAVERAQEIMYILSNLRSKGIISADIPIYLDSPMGSDATKIMLKYPEWHKLTNPQCKRLQKDIKMVKSLKETLAIIGTKKPKIIIAGSGMLSGGRALEYLKTYIGRTSTTILFVGFQAEGTRGKALLNGAAEIKIHGEYYECRANIRELTSLSGHADSGEILSWLSGFKKIPGHIFLNHGELVSSEALRVKIKEKYGKDCQIPLLNSKFSI